LAQHITRTFAEENTGQQWQSNSIKEPLMHSWSGPSEEYREFARKLRRALYITRVIHRARRDRERALNRKKRKSSKTDSF
jgi:hypothetical protein